jgi:hypothetical protein
MQFESKEDMKKRGVSSPDSADALALMLSKATEGSNLGIMCCNMAAMGKFCLHSL